MKITQLMLAKGFGGGERLFVDLVNALSQAGNDVLAICQVGSDTERRLKNNLNIRLKTVRAFSTRDPFVWRVIAANIAAHNSEIVQSHMSRGTYLAGKSCKRLNKPLVVTLHNYINLKYYKNVTKFIPATRDQFDYLLQKGVPEERMELIPHFSHINPVAEASFNQGESLVFACYGRMVKKKGFHLILSAFEKLTATDINAKLVIGGNGPEMAALKSQCKALGLDELVQFSGWIKEVEAFLEKIDVFVLPSLDEPFGIAVLEAMAVGKPIVSSKSQGPAETLNNENAYLAELNDVDSLFEAMCAAATDKKTRERKARQALNDYKSFYSKEVVIPQFLNLYKDVVSKTPCSIGE